MGRRWNSYKFQFVCFVALILGLEIQGSSSPNLEGSTLLKIRSSVDSDPYNSLGSWDPEDDDQCKADNCVDGEVQTLRKYSTEFWLDHGDNQIGNLESSYVPNMLQNHEEHDRATVLRRRLATQSTNLEAVPTQVNRAPFQSSSQPISISSGSFPASTKEKNPPNTEQNNRPTQPSSAGHSNANKGRPSGKVWVYIAVAIGSIILLAVVAALFFVWRSRWARPIGPFKTGISGQLQKAFVTGVPNLNRPELETACEDFSNIIATFDAFTIYKGTLSSGVEIAVASTRVTSVLDWSESAELAYRKKIETLSRVNHKNYVNLLGYCEENEPFTRMMVFEYAPSGSLFEHLHVKEIEHIDWSARMRVIMGAAYCLQYMHHDLNPPVVHPKLSSSAIYLSDDYAAKIVEQPFDVIHKEVLGENGSKQPEPKTRLDPTENTYDFGILLLEVITGKLPFSEEYGSLVEWAKPYLEIEESTKDLIDPLLKSVKMKELEVICQVIQDCVKPNPWQRPTMQEVTCRLKEVIPVTPEAAVPRLSPLWWAELEILSAEAT